MIQIINNISNTRDYVTKQQAEIKKQCGLQVTQKDNTKIEKEQSQQDVQQPQQECNQKEVEQQVEQIQQQVAQEDNQQQEKEEDSIDSLAAAAELSHNEHENSQQPTDINELLDF